MLSLMEKKMSIIDKTGHRIETLGEVKSNTHKATAMANSSRDETTEVVFNREMTNVRTTGNAESKDRTTSSLTIHMRMDQIKTGTTTSMNQTRQMNGL